MRRIFFAFPIFVIEVLPTVFLSGCVELGDNLAMRALAHNPRCWYARALVSYADGQLARESARVNYLMSQSFAAMTCADTLFLANYYEKKKIFDKAITLHIIAAYKGQNSGYVKASQIAFDAQKYEIAYPLLVKAQKIDFAGSYLQKLDSAKKKLRERGLKESTIKSYEDAPDFWIKEYVLDRECAVRMPVSEAIQRGNSLGNSDEAQLCYYIAALNGEVEAYYLAANVDKNRGRYFEYLVGLYVAKMRGSKLANKDFNDSDIPKEREKEFVDAVAEVLSLLDKKLFEDTWLKDVSSKR